MVDPLREVFPNLGAYQVTSPRFEKYNCIAWAGGDATQWWWPDEGPGIFWPTVIPKEETISAFVALFAYLRYTECPNADNEYEYEKIALYADTDGVPLHAARLLPAGRWTSKLGRAEDIEHALYDLEGAEYGKVVLVMRRPIGTGPP